MQRMGDEPVTRPKPEPATMASPTHRRTTMRTLSIHPNGPFSHLGLAAAAMLAVALALAASNASEAQERAADNAPTSAATLVAAIRPIDPTLDQHPTTDTWQSTPITAGEATDSVIVGANLPDPEAWDSFDRSMSSAATSSCFGPDALPHGEFAVEGLLRLPFLVRAAAASSCR
jgi:hypothetical protein